MCAVRAGSDYRVNRPGESVKNIRHITDFDANLNYAMRFTPSFIDLFFSASEGLAGESDVEGFAASSRERQQPITLFFHHQAIALCEPLEQLDRHHGAVGGP